MYTEMHPAKITKKNCLFVLLIFPRGSFFLFLLITSPIWEQTPSLKQLCLLLMTYRLMSHQLDTLEPKPARGASEILGRSGSSTASSGASSRANPLSSS